MECPTENGAPIELYFFSVHGDLEVSEAQGVRGGTTAAFRPLR